MTRMTQATTESEEYQFTVKEYSDGTPWIALEPSHRALESLGNSLLGLELNEGSTYQRAEEVARYLNQNIVSVAHTTFD